ncbi:MAG: acyl-CoA dehydrogenase family protein [Candidatus Binatia bacterium]
MNFGFSQEQEMLRENAARFLDAECPAAFVRTVMAGDTGHCRELWTKMAELGWLGILVPEEYGGTGGSFLDLAVVLEEMGKTLLPGPFFATVLLGSTAVLAGGSAAQKRRILPSLVHGDLMLTLALAEESGRFDAQGVALAAARADKGFALNGEKLFVPDAHVADRIIVAARTTQSRDAEHGITLFEIDAKAPGVGVTQLRTVDMTRRLCRVALDNVRVSRRDVLGRINGGWAVLCRVLDHATAGLSMEMVGTAQRALDMSVRYARERIQFGKPIGSFQAVKHKCVDMMVQVENARSLCYYAAWAVTEGAPEARQAVAMAKAYCSDMCKTVCSEAIQAHGGIGFTWEHDLHLFYRRALAAEAHLGNAPVHREAVARQLVRRTRLAH